MSLDDPFGAIAVVNGMLFIASSATLFGILTGTPKTFTVIFLLFLYVASSSKGSPSFDFAGLQGIATSSILLTYLAASILMVVTAMGFDTWRMKRDDDYVAS